MIRYELIAAGLRCGGLPAPIPAITGHASSGRRAGGGRAARLFPALVPEHPRLVPLPVALGDVGALVVLLLAGARPMMTLARPFSLNRISSGTMVAPSRVTAPGQLRTCLRCSSSFFGRSGSNFATESRPASR
jgi:hypothetical protein